MVKKISFLLLSTAILVTGYIAVNKLNYWDRSIRNVLWFLAVFASFAVIVIYLDKAYCRIRKRKD
ncbi:MAG: hypothetical protein MUO72_18525 [Bacteroidales bacterium]|nr:hypothetical protein [Bacteroidales bacterium]